jgi:glutamine cyclotransferase
VKTSRPLFTRTGLFGNKPGTGRIILAAVTAAILLILYEIPEVSGEEAHLQPGTPPYTFRIVTVYPHDPSAFTQGLFFHDGFLYESTGLHGRSSLRKVDLKTGRVLKFRRLPRKYFGEGIALHGKRIFQITWQSKTGFIYDPETFRRIGQFSYEWEGWGITSDGAHLIMSDGTSTLRFLDPQTFRVTRKMDVTDAGKLISGLNELEYVKGEIYANLWNTGYIIRISPETGDIRGWIDLRRLYAELGGSKEWDILNGIAYDAENDRLFVTGKFWPKLFEIKIIRNSP